MFSFPLSPMVPFLFVVAIVQAMVIPHTPTSRRSMLQSTVVATSSSILLTPAISTAVDVNNNDLRTGVPAPNFALPSSNNDNNNADSTTTLSLQQLLSSREWIVLYFYPGAFSAGCTLEARKFQTDAEQYRALNAHIVGISVDPPRQHVAFCTAEKLDSITMLSDAGGRVSKLYGATVQIPGFGSVSNRQTYLIDPNGIVRWVFQDVENRIPQHSAEVLEKLTELTGGVNGPVGSVV